MGGSFDLGGDRMKENDFYIPETKKELVAWLKKYYAVNKEGKKINWDYFTTGRLKLIYIIRRKKMEAENAPHTEKKIGIPKSVTEEQLRFPFN